MTKCITWHENGKRLEPKMDGSGGELDGNWEITTGVFTCSGLKCCCEGTEVTYVNELECIWEVGVVELAW